jgi:ankyrin repeat protein
MSEARSFNCFGTIRAMLCAYLVCKGLGAQIPAKVEFARDIQPLFRDHCIECHGPSQQMRGLRLDRRRDAMPNRVGANGARIVPGNSARSTLYRRVSATQSGAQMPPSGPLPPEQIDLIRAWIDQGADWPDEISGDRDTVPADPAVVSLRNALRNGDRQEFNRVLRDRPEAVNAKGPSGWTPIMYAALYGDGDAVRLLLDKGANPNARNNQGGTALMYAIDNEEKTRLLLDHGADPNLHSGEGRTALQIATGRAGAYPIVKLLLDKGADAGGRPPDGRGALNSAIGSRDPDLLQLLLNHGIDKKGLPLGPVLVAGCTACFDVLLPLAQAADLSGGLQGAVRMGDLRRIQTLLDRGAQPAGNLLQTVAASRAAIPLDHIRSLIAAGADVNVKTSTGVTLLDFANRNGNAALAEALTTAGVRGETRVPSQLLRKPSLSARAAVESVLPALQRADVAFIERAGCVSCHNNSLTAMTIAAARAAGVTVNERIAKDQSRRIAAFLQENGERALENDGLPGGVDTVSYILLGLSADGYPGDPVTDVWARYVKNNQSPDGRWTCQALRPPLESSDFQVTAASIKSLKAYGPRSQRPEYDKTVERAVHWLETAPGSTTEDLVFKILGLIWGGGSQAAIRATAQRLQALQGSDGGWSQIQALPSDPYATGQVLVALREARVARVNSTAYRRGIQFLLNSQLEDGSWHVASRAAAIQPYFDSAFPHGPDQFISAAASNWASMALLTVLR